jgi:fucose permease
MSTTTQLEPSRVESYPLSNLSDKPASPKRAPSPQPETPGDDQQPPGLDRATKLKLIAAGFSFFVSGTNDGSIGALIPYVLRDYQLSTAIASIV